MISIPVKSSNIKAIFYDDTSNKLLVFFLNNSLYSYSIKETKIGELINAEDKGKFFYDNIRMNYPYKRIY